MEGSRLPRATQPASSKWEWHTTASCPTSRCTGRFLGVCLSSGAKELRNMPWEVHGILPADHRSLLCWNQWRQGFLPGDIGVPAPPTSPTTSLTQSSHQPSSPGDVEPATLSLSTIILLRPLNPRPPGVCCYEYIITQSSTLGLSDQTPSLEGWLAKQRVISPVSSSTRKPAHVYKHVLRWVPYGPLCRPSQRWVAIITP